MRNIFSTSFALASVALFSADTGTGSDVPTVETPAIQPETVTEKPVKTKRSKPAAKPVAGKRKPVAAKPETEAKPDPRAARAERIAADRSTVSAIYAAFEQQRASVPVKPLSAFKPTSTTAHPVARHPSIRQAAAIAVAFAAAGKQLKPGISVPRVFEADGIRSCIENGVLRDAVSSGLVSVSGDTPETESIKLSAKADKAIVGFLGEKLCRKAKLIAAA